MQCCRSDEEMGRCTKQECIAQRGRQSLSALLILADNTEMDEDEHGALVPDIDRPEFVELLSGAGDSEGEIAAAYKQATHGRTMDDDMLGFLKDTTHTSWYRVTLTRGDHGDDHDASSAKIDTKFKEVWQRQISPWKLWTHLVIDEFFDGLAATTAQGKFQPVAVCLPVVHIVGHITNTAFHIQDPDSGAYTLGVTKNASQTVNLYVDGRPTFCYVAAGTMPSALSLGTASPLVPKASRKQQFTGQIRQGTPADTPAADTAAADTPAADTPAANTPAADTPAANTPAANPPDNDEPSDADDTTNQAEAEENKKNVQNTQCKKSKRSEYEASSDEDTDNEAMGETNNDDAEEGETNNDEAMEGETTNDDAEERETNNDEAEERETNNDEAKERETSDDDEAKTDLDKKSTPESTNEDAMDDDTEDEDLDSLNSATNSVDTLEKGGGISTAIFVQHGGVQIDGPDEQVLKANAETKMHVLRHVTLTYGEANAEEVMAFTPPVTFSGFLKRSPRFAGPEGSGFDPYYKISGYATAAAAQKAYLNDSRGRDFGGINLVAEEYLPDDPVYPWSTVVAIGDAHNPPKWVPRGKRSFVAETHHVVYTMMPYYWVVQTETGNEYHLCGGHVAPGVTVVANKGVVREQDGLVAEVRKSSTMTPKKVWLMPSGDNAATVRIGSLDAEDIKSAYEAIGPVGADGGQVHEWDRDRRDDKAHSHHCLQPQIANQARHDSCSGAHRRDARSDNSPDQRHPGKGAGRRRCRDVLK